MSLSEKVCGACNRYTPRLPPEEIERLSLQVPGWTVASNQNICREWKFKNFMDALAFVNAVAVIAEQENHHPDVEVGWGYARLTLTTHAIKALSENDFILAAKIDTLTPTNAST